MNSYKKLVNNSLIFGVGTLGSKVISIILVPLYTYYLSTSEFGTVDLVTTTVNMLLPIISASIFEAVLRFVMDKDSESDVILSNSLFIAVYGIIIAIACYPILSHYNVFGENLLYFYLILIFQIFEKIFEQYSRAIGKVKIFALNGVLLTFLIGILNVLFIVFLGMGVYGYFYSLIIANLISINFLVFATAAYKDIQISKLSKDTTRTLLIYAAPMIPNALMWWLINASSRYFILYFVGVSANGLFAVASKIPSLISIINQVFTQAWQLSAIEEYDSHNKSTFYTNVFNYFSSIMFIGTSTIIVINKFLFTFFFSADYFKAWEVVPFLLIGAFFSSFSGFLGTNYVAAKQTKGVFKTSVYGGIISLILNFFFIPFFGIVGAGISSMISFFVMFLVRYFDTKKFIEMQINWSMFFFSILILLIQTIILFINLSLTTEVIIEITLLILLVMLNRHLSALVLKIIKSLGGRIK